MSTKTFHMSDNKRLLELMRLGTSMGRPDAAEIYSPPRVTSIAHRFNLIPGFALDLSVIYPEDGMPWDFDKPEKNVQRHWRY